MCSGQMSELRAKRIYCMGVCELFVLLLIVNILSNPIEFM